MCNKELDSEREIGKGLIYDGLTDKFMKKIKTYFKTLKDQMQWWRLRKLNIIRKQLEMARNIVFPIE